MPDEKLPVSFIGLGAMGFGMATHLVKQGYPVTGFDVWAPTLERFRAAGGLTATTPSEAVAEKPFCVCMVATAQQAQSVLLDGPEPAVPALPKGAVLLLCSTVPCDYVQSLDRQLRSIGRDDILLVDSPVSGGAARAADGTLSIMAGMSDAAVEKARPLLAEMADPAKLYMVQGGIGAGSNMKMVHQVLAACQILAASEAMGFAQGLGLDLARAQKAVLASDAWNWMFEHRTPRMLTQFQPVASAVNIIVKDTGIITAEAKRRGFRVPMTAAAESGYREAVAKGYGADDDSSLLRLYTVSGTGTAASEESPANKTDEEKLALVVDLLRAINLCAAGESLAFADAVGLDLDQVLDLCVNAAGASTLLKIHGPAIINALRVGAASKNWTAKDGEPSLGQVADRLEHVVQSAEQLKVPLFLASQALHVFREALHSAPPGLAVAAVANVWRGPNSAE
jgi:3-hydroxyisobutyrate dehydrogenase-like beta-hydroxyacid dehydrogenase